MAIRIRRYTAAFAEVDTVSLTIGVVSISDNLCRERIISRNYFGSVRVVSNKWNNYEARLSIVGADQTTLGFWEETVKNNYYIRILDGVPSFLATGAIRQVVPSDYNVVQRSGELFDISLTLRG